MGAQGWWTALALATALWIPPASYMFAIPILALAPVVASMQIFLDAGLPELIKKSRTLTNYLRWLIELRFPDQLGILTREDARGAQLSLVVKNPAIDAKALFDRLCALNVTGDWREPDVIRVAPVPLYNSFEDAFTFAERMATALRVSG